MRSVADIDWATWVPTMRGTLLFVRDGDQVLLIRKRRGLGAGKINGPGGKLEPGETPLQCAVREVEEEVGVTAHDPIERGELYFQFVDGLRLHVLVFDATAFSGEPVDTEEAFPLWVAEREIPYHEMWADDRVWLPHMLAGRPFVLRAVFEGDAMLDHTIEVERG
jgi:8-oxo-dGTP diphosphatase